MGGSATGPTEEEESDHNPHVRDGATGDDVVTALDLTHDPNSGCDAGVLAEVVIASRDPRIKYIIWNRRIVSGDAGPSPWVKRQYTGSDPHNLHVHISVKPTKAEYDNDAAWALSGAAPPATPSAPPPPAEVEKRKVVGKAVEAHTGCPISAEASWHNRGRRLRERDRGGSQEGSERVRPSSGRHRRSVYLGCASEVNVPASVPAPLAPVKPGSASHRAIPLRNPGRAFISLTYVTSARSGAGLPVWQADDRAGARAHARLPRAKVIQGLLAERLACGPLLMSGFGGYC